MSIFDRLDQMTSRTVDSVNAIAFTFTPMTSTPNGRQSVDTDRPVVSGTGIFDLIVDDAPLELGNRDRRGNDLRSLLATSRPVLSVDRRYFPVADQEPRQGDQVEFPGRPDLGRHEVVSLQRDGQSRVELRLVRVG